eukprot:3744184-Pleurochrysis_carterae.AAC.1
MAVCACSLGSHGFKQSLLSSQQLVSDAGAIGRCEEPDGCVLPPQHSSTPSLSESASKSVQSAVCVFALSQPQVQLELDATRVLALLQRVRAAVMMHGSLYEAATLQVPPVQGCCILAARSFAM